MPSSDNIMGVVHRKPDVGLDGLSQPTAAKGVEMAACIDYSGVSRSRTGPRAATPAPARKGSTRLASRHARPDSAQPGTGVTNDSMHVSQGRPSQACRPITRQIDLHSS